MNIALAASWKLDLVEAGEISVVQRMTRPATKCIFVGTQVRDDVAVRLGSVRHEGARVERNCGCGSAGWMTA